jgi:hypothetical protein
MGCTHKFREYSHRAILKSDNLANPAAMLFFKINSADPAGSRLH